MRKVIDPDNPPLTAADFAKARPLTDKERASWRKSVSLARGRPRLADPKLQVTLRLDSAVVSHFKAQGSGWQTRVNEALRKAAKLPR